MTAAMIVSSGRPRVWRSKKESDVDSAFQLNVALLFNQQVYSDLTITLKDRSIFCHKVIICSNSKYFADLCGPSAKFKEKEQDMIELKEDDAAAMEMLLQWLYNKKYASISSANSTSAGPSCWRLHLHVALAADKYLLPTLEIAALDKLQDTIGDGNFPAAEAAQMLGAIHTMNVTAPVAEMADRMRKRNIFTLLDEPVFRALLDDESELRWEIIDGLVSSARFRSQRSPPTEVRVQCLNSGCEKIFNWKFNEELQTVCASCGNDMSTFRMALRG